MAYYANEFGDYPTEDELLDADIAASEAASEAADYAAERAAARGQDPWAAAMRVHRHAPASKLLADRPF